jgi:uncharacterized protein
MSRILFGLAVVVFVYWGFLFLTQRSLMYPAPAMPAMSSRGSAQVVQLPLADGPVDALYLVSTAGHAGPAPLLIFAHGNAELADDWVEMFDEPRTWGWAVLLLEYPGYGRSAGKPSERSITAAILAAYDWARRNPRIDPARIVPYGRSLGGGAAARLAADRQVPAVILESCFTSARAFAWRFLAPGFLVRDPFDNLAALRGFRGPLLVLHGSHDDIIPVAHGRALATAVAGAEFHEIPCGHNDCPRSWPRIRAFLAAHDLMPGDP